MFRYLTRRSIAPKTPVAESEQLTALANDVAFALTADYSPQEQLRGPHVGQLRDKIADDLQDARDSAANVENEIARLQGELLNAKLAVDALTLAYDALNVNYRDGGTIVHKHILSVE